MGGVKTYLIHTLGDVTKEKQQNTYFFIKYIFFVQNMNIYDFVMQRGFEILISNSVNLTLPT